MAKMLWTILAAGSFVTGLGLSVHDAAADQPRKKPRPASQSTGTAPSRSTDLNSPATDFSSVSPVIDDPKAELLKPRKKKDFFNQSPD